MQRKTSILKNETSKKKLINKTIDWKILNISKCSLNWFAGPIRGSSQSHVYRVRTNTIALANVLLCAMKRSRKMGGADEQRKVWSGNKSVKRQIAPRNKHSLPQKNDRCNRCIKNDQLIDILSNIRVNRVSKRELLVLCGVIGNVKGKSQQENINHPVI